VRPNTPIFFFIEVAFGAADGLIDEGESAGETDTSGAGVEFQEFLVGKIREADGFVLHGMAGGG
jgi:hypothetical protein